ncbi:MAG: CCA tRNA nucleotidyltransferase [Sphaerochaetaceae bacterium]
MKKFPVTASIKRFASFFLQGGFSLYIVGGAVRDFYAHRKSTDYDFATDAKPDQIQKLFKRVIPTGIEHGTVTILFDSQAYEVTTFRSDGTYSDKRHPDTVSFVTSLAEDLSRRDFTINAMAVDASNGLLTDLFGGLDDLKAKTIKAIGNPAQRFGEDALRILRACRFASQLQFTIETKTQEAMKHLSHSLTAVSKERVQQELMHILASEIPSIGLKAAKECGALFVLIPEFEQCDGLLQPPKHHFDVLSHLFVACDAAPLQKPLVRLAALLHDIGKPLTKGYNADGQLTYYHHEKKSAELAFTILKRLKFSNAHIAAVTHLIANHMFVYSPEWSDAAVRRFIKTVGTDFIDDLFALKRADRWAINGTTDYSDLVELQSRITNELQMAHALKREDLAINGHDLLKLGIQAGPQMKLILDQLLETVLDDPSQNTKEHLSRIAVNFWRQRMA